MDLPNTQKTLQIGCFGTGSNDLPKLNIHSSNAVTTFKGSSFHLNRIENSTLVYLAVGLTDKSIAVLQKVSLRTVQNRVSCLFSKVIPQSILSKHLVDGGINLRVILLLEALKQGILNLEQIEKAQKELLSSASSTTTISSCK